jgi:hypothetical protein
MLGLIEEQALLDQLEQPAAEKAKEAEAWTCKYTGCNVKYTDATSNQQWSQKQEELRLLQQCSECRELMKKAQKCRVARKCEHGRNKHICKDCGTGHCQHGRQKHQCKDCGTGYCQHEGRCQNSTDEKKQNSTDA